MRLQVLHGVRLRRSRDRNELVDAFLLSRVQFIHFFLSFLVTGVGVVVVLFLSRAQVFCVPLFFCVKRRKREAFFSLLFFHFSLLFSFYRKEEASERSPHTLVLLTRCLGRRRRRRRRRLSFVSFSFSFSFSFSIDMASFAIKGSKKKKKINVQEEEENEEREAVFAVGKDDARAKEERKKEEEKIIPAMRNTFEVGTGRQRKVRVDIAPRYSLQGVCYFLLGGICCIKTHLL